MEKEKIIIEKQLNAPVEKVWKALTDKEEMKKWYFQLKEFKPEPGFKFQFTAGKNEDQQYVHLCEIKKVEINKRLAYSWHYQDFPGNSLVTFELQEDKDKTTLRLTHEGLTTFPQDNADFAYDSFKEGWTYIVETGLPKYLQDN